MGKRMDDWLAQHGRLEHLAAPLLRPAAALLSLRLRPPERDRLEGRARGARDSAGSTSSRSSAARGSTRCRSRCESCGEEVRRVAEVGDVWLDAGIVPFSTLGWQNPEYVPAGYATGAAEGPDHRRPARPRLLGGVVPGRLGLGDARADPALVLLAALHVGRAHGPRAVPAGARLREDARRDRPRDARVVGEHDRGRGGVRAHGRRRDALAVLRPAARPRTSSSASGPRTRSSASCSRSGTRRASSSTTRTIDGFQPDRMRRPAPARARRSTAGSPPAPTQLVAEATAGYEAFLTRGRDPGVRGVRRRPLQLVHPPLAPALLGRRRERAADALDRARPGRCAWSRR